MNLDWVIAVSVFLVFVGLGFGFYWTLFETNANPVQASLEPVNQKVIGYLRVDSWKVPVRYSSATSTQAVMYFDFAWPEGTINSTRINYGGLDLDCLIEGGRLYFQADVQQGDNDFEMTFMNATSPMHCTWPIDKSEANLSIPWVAEKSVAISQSRIDQMLATDYTQFRESLGIARNFRVQAGQSSFGPQPPQYTNTYVKESRYLMQETGQPTTVTVMVW